MEETALVKAVGLDFGTTNSALAIAKSDGMVRLAQFRDGATFRSIIYFEEHDSAPTKLRVVAGPDAIQSYLGAKTPGRLIQSMKSYLASRLFTQTQILGETYALEDLISILLRHIENRRKSSSATWVRLWSSAGRYILAVRETQLTTSLLSAGYASPSATPVSRTSTFYLSPSPPPTSTSSASITKSSC